MSDKVINIDVKSLKSKLEWGDLTKIARKLNISEQSVHQQLSGKTKTVKSEVLDAALGLLEERNKTVARLNKRINK